MANPNIVNVTTITGNTAAFRPAVTTATTMVTNASGSGTILKVNFLSCANANANVVSTTVTINSAAGGGGTAANLAYQIPIPVNAALIVTDKSTSFYLIEDRSLVVTSNVASAIDYVCSYEVLS